MFRVAHKKDEKKDASPKVEMEINIDGKEKDAEDPKEDEGVASDLEEEMPMTLDSYPAHKVDPHIVLYMGSEMGPFECQHCINWMGDGECGLVGGPIDPMGKCNLFEPIGPALDETPIDDRVMLREVDEEDK